MVEGGCPLNEALRLVGELEAGSAGRADLERWQQRLAAGHGAFPAIAEGSLAVPPLFVWIVASSGDNLAAGFKRAAEIYHDRALRKTEALLYAVLPMSVLVLGTLILIQALTMAYSIMGDFSAVDHCRRIAMNILFSSDFWTPLIEGIRAFLEFAIPAALMVLAWLIPCFILLGAAYLVLMRPQKRRERAQLFFDVLETGHASGQSLEHAIVALARSRDLTLGVHFHLLAAHIENGLTLSQALTRVPSFLPPPCAALLQAGGELQDYRNVLPVCRHSLAGTTSRSQGGLNYLLAFPPVILVALGIAAFISTVILPKFEEIIHELLQGQPLPWETQWVFQHVTAPNIVAVLLLIALAVVTGAAVFLARRTPPVKPVLDRIWFSLPWRRKRLQRDFSGLLGLLLDAGLPEPTAVTVAATGTANSVFIHRAAATVRRLAAGEPLSRAIAALDDTGEFVWRLQNAAHGAGGFATALAGWHDALEAKAYQQEQTVSQILSTVMVVANGALVALIAVAVFQALTTIVGDMALW